VWQATGGYTEHDYLRDVRALPPPPPPQQQLPPPPMPPRQEPPAAAKAQKGVAGSVAAMLSESFRFF
jgi:hypothetical protein